MRRRVRMSPTTASTNTGPDQGLAALGGSWRLFPHASLAKTRPVTGRQGCLVEVIAAATTHGEQKSRLGSKIF